MGEVKLLRLLQVLQQRAAGADGGGAVLEPGLVHIGEAELLADTGGAGQIFKIPRLLLGHGVQLIPQEGYNGAVFRRAGGEHRFPRKEAGELVADMLLPVPREGGTAELTGRELAEGDAGAASGEEDGADVVAAVLGEHGAVRDGAGGDDPDDIALHQSLGQGRVLQLLTDGDLVAFGDELCDVTLGAVIGDAAHGRALFGILDIPVPGGERQVQFPGGGDGVVVEHLIEVAETEEEQAVAVLLLDLLILALHRGKLSHCTPLPFRTGPRCCRR